jgi:hypothetical protein
MRYGQVDFDAEAGAWFVHELQGSPVDNGTSR